MVIQLASDLHFEMHRDGGASLLGELIGSGADVLVLAGDIAYAKTPDSLRFVFGEVSPHYKHVIYVPGNHEYYGTTPGVARTNIDQVVSEFKNVYAPDNAMVELDGQRFLVGTGWFPHPDPIAATARMYMNDFYQIKHFEPWVYGQHDRFDALLAKKLEASDVVITHHLPSSKSVPPQFTNSALNSFFISHFEHWIQQHQPGLWLHGHTHTQTDYQIGKTRVVANPLGYPSEIFAQTAFQPHLTISI